MTVVEHARTLVSPAVYARTLRQIASEIRELKGCVSLGYRPGVDRLAARVEYLASAADSVRWDGGAPGEHVSGAARTPNYARNRRARAKNPQPGQRECSKCRRLLPAGAFSVTDAATGKRRADCKACYNQSQRQRYVRAGYKVVTVEVLEGDPCVGHPCAVCGRPFEPGQRLQGDNLAHETCVADGGGEP